MEAPQVLTAGSFMIAWYMFPVYRIRAFRKTYDLADDDPKAKQLAERRTIRTRKSGNEYRGYAKAMSSSVRHIPICSTML